MRGTALLALLLLSSCAPALTGALKGGEREEAARFFRARWSAPSFPLRASFTGTATAPSAGAGSATPMGQGPGPSDAWPVVVGLEALSPDRETLGVFDPFGHEVIVARNDGAFLSFQGGPLAGPLAFLDNRSLPVPSISLGRLFAGAPAFEPKDGEYSRGEGGEWVLESKAQTLRSDGGRKALASASYRLYGREIAVSYPGREGEGPPAEVRVEALGGTITVRRDRE